MIFKRLSNFELLNLFKMYVRTLGDEHSLTMRVQEELYIRLEVEGD